MKEKMFTITPPLPLGRILATPMSLAALERAGIRPADLLKRLQHGHDGDLHPDDRLANLRARRFGLRVLSAYHLLTGDRIWIMTDGEPRHHTTIMLAEEY